MRLSLRQFLTVVFSHIVPLSGLLLLARVVTKPLKRAILAAAGLFTIVSLTSCSGLVSSSGVNSGSYAFPGISNLSVLPGGSFALSWPATPPDSGSAFLVYSRRSNLGESYNFSADPLLTTTDTTAKTDVFPLNETRCFVVRARSDNYKSDTNTKELCSSDDGLSDFSGIYAATSLVLGQVNVSWAKSVNPGVKGYNVYLGTNFSLKVGVAGASESAFVVTGLSPGQRLEFGVRAFDKNGREDNNTAVQSVVVSAASAAAGDFPGCASATALDTSNILVGVEFPAGASSMSIFRDGISVATLALGTTTQYLDSGLTEGKTYQYTCRALVAGTSYVGTRSIDATTLNVNPPSFGGVSSVTALGARSLRVAWASSSGVNAASYKVWVALGSFTTSSFDFSQAPTATLSSGVLETIVTNLGDELTYTAAVRACSATGICDTNTTVVSKTLADGGAPTSVGATAVAMVNGSAQLTVPWDAGKGAVKYRQIYMRTGVTGGTNIANYTLLREEVVSDVANPPTTITVTSLAQNTMYHFIVRDKDPSGNVNTNTNFVSVASGDLSAPVFAGITALNTGASGVEDTTLVAQFAAVTPESIDSNGPSYYLVYKTSDGSDPCASGVTATAQLIAADYSAGQTVSYTLTGLTPRTTYKVCIKARDAASNLSATSASLNKTTKDITAPTFSGIQTISYSTATSKLSLTWNAAYSPTDDLGSYVITIWKNSVTPASPVTITKAVSTPGISSGISLTSSDFAMSSLDTVYAYVNACDNAAPTYAASNNCTALTTAKSATLPDIDPPSGFGGIASVTPVAGTNDSLLVSWNAPTDWSDYRGFKIYSVATDATTEAGLTFVKDCYCSTSGATELTACSVNHLTSCTVSGLDSRRTYNYYVRAFDAAGNLTPVTSPWTTRRYAQTLDVAAPTFNSNLNIVWQASPAGIFINYSAATDNQYASEPGASITYKIYRKADSTFASATNPSADGTLIPAATSVSYLDVAANLLESHTYYYAVCAVDASNNTTCDGMVRSQAVIDYTPPVFPGGITSLVLGSPTDTSLTATWTAIAPEGTGAGQSANGATAYTIYVSGTAVNPCTAGSLAGTKSALSYAAGDSVSYPISGLNQRTAYRVCVKARDAALNESATANYLVATTSDITPPSFGGALTALYNNPQTRLDITWSTATSDVSPTDVSSYMVSVWDVASCTPNCSVTVFTKPASSNATGTNIINGTTDVALGKFNFVSGATVKVLVNACDDYNNCSQIAASSAITVNIPDTVAPVVTLTAPIANAAGQTGLTFTGTCESGLLVYITGTGLASSPVTTACTSSAFSQVLNFSAGEGTKQFSLQQTDAAGNASTPVTVSVLRDNTSPVVSIGSPSASRVNFSSPVTYTATFSDTGTGASGVGSVSLVNSQVLLTTTGTATCTKSVSVSGTASATITLSGCTGDGTVAVGVPSGVLADGALNLSAAAGPSLTFTVDNTPPSIAITLPTAGASYNSSSVVTVSGTCEAGGSVTVSGAGVQTPSTTSCPSGTFSTTIALTAGEGSKVLGASQTDLVGNTGTSASVTVTLDNTPPALFAGLTSITALSPRSSSNGSVTATWFAPASWTDYAGFKIYAVIGDDSTCSRGQANEGACLTLLKSCTCAQTSCADHLTSCTVDGLNPGRNYYFYARAFDAAGNLSDIASPNLLAGKKLFRVPDLVAPAFSSGLARSWNNITKAIGLTWNAATDNQYYDASDALNNSNSVGYKVYRKAGSTFASATNPSADGTLLTNTPDTQLTYTDLKSGGLVEGTTYYYTVCAYDRANLESGSPAANTTCDGAVVNYTIPDETAPVISAIAASPLLPNKTNQPFSVSWSLSDNVASNGTIAVVVYRTVTPSASTATTAAGVYDASAGLTSVTAQSGTDNADEYFNYLIVATDPSGNVGQATYTVKSDRINPNLIVTSPAVGTTTRALHYEVAGTCEYGAGVTTTVSLSGAGAQVVSQSCSAGGVLSAKITLPEGGSAHTLTVTNTDASGNATIVTRSFVSIACPTGYVGVPGKWTDDTDVAGLGNASATANNSDPSLNPTRDFCVMKYPAKAATSNNGGQQAWEPVYDGNKTFTMTNYWPESRADSTPWVNISRDQSIDRCKALNEAYGHCSGAGCYSTFDNSTWGYRLMSNTEWQVIARNLEKTGANWTSGTVGTGYLWRGHSDNTLTSASTNLHTQTYNGASQLALSNPKSDAGNSDYFGTGNDATQNSSGTAGWQERRRFVLSTGASVWDMAGNVWQWVSDNRSALGIPAADDTAGMTSNAWYSYLNGASNRFSATGNLIFGNLGSGGTQFSEAKNAGQLYGGSAGAVLRGGYWGHTSNDGLFSAHLYYAPSYTSYGVGFRCVFLPPPLTGPLDTGAPAVAVQRVDGTGFAVANNVVTVSAGGFWNLGISVSDAENTGVDANKIFVQVRRKVASTSSDFPTSADSIYRSGYLISSLANETAWTLGSNNQYTRNDGTYVNYLVTAIDAAGNSGSATFSVQNTQSCPPGYVGVPGNSTAGLGNANATIGNSNAALDPSRDFCVMKYPAKVMSAGTTAAQTTVGGLFEPIMDGNATFANTYTYTDAATFASGIKYLPESRSSGTPWVNISRDVSISACRALQMQYFGTMPDTATGTGFQLISNTEWQVVARNAEAQSVNWSNNAVGNGVLNRGHSDNAISATEVTNSWCFGCTAPSTSLSGAPNSVSDANYYFATGNSSGTAWNMLGASPAAGTEQKRTHTLSNGVVTWDFAGNVWQWVSDNNAATRTSDDMGVSNTVRAWSAWKEYNDAGLTVSDKLLFGSAGGYTSSKNAGQIYGASAGAVLRGGYWNNTSNDGLFTANLNNAPSNTNDSIGFRCVFLP